MLTYEDIREPLIEAIRNDRKAQQLYELIQSGAGTYNTASEYAIRVGECLARILRQNAPFESIAEWDLENLIPQALGLDHEYVVQACEQVQLALNADAGLGINYVSPKFDGNRAYGIVAELRDNPEFVNIERTFYDQLVNFSQNVVDESIRSNATVLSNAGVQSKVVRHTEAGACAWCRAVAGTYDYADVRRTGNDVWRRHENCRCTIDFITERNGSEYRERVNNYRTSEPMRRASSSSSNRNAPSQIRRLTDEERNLSDEQRRQLAEAAERLAAYRASQK